MSTTASSSAATASDPAADADADAPAHVLELYATAPHTRLAATWPGGADPDAADADADPLAPLRALVSSADTVTADANAHDLAWGVLAYRERPFLALTVRWHSLGDLDALVAALNASRVLELVLRFRCHASSAAPRLFDTLATPLYGLMLHDAGPELSTAPIARYLRSERARTLHRLFLLQDAYADPEFAAPILDALSDTGRVGALRLGGPSSAWEDEYFPGRKGRSGLPIVNRLPALMWRNDQLQRALRKAAAQVLVPARVLLRARAAPSPETAPTPAPFRVLDLPLHILANILRFTASDAAALSDRQLARLLAHAGSPRALAALADAVADTQRPRKIGGELISDEAYATLLADADNPAPGAVIAQRIASLRLKTVIVPTFADAMDRWLAAGGFHVE